MGLWKCSTGVELFKLEFYTVTFWWISFVLPSLYLPEICRPICFSVSVFFSRSSHYFVVTCGWLRARRQQWTERADCGEGHRSCRSSVVRKPTHIGSVGRWLDCLVIRRWRWRSLYSSIILCTVFHCAMSCVVWRSDNGVDQGYYHFSGISRNLEMSGNLAKVREKSGKRPKVRERLGNLCSRGNLIVAAQQNN